MVTATISIAAFALFIVCILAVDKSEDSAGVEKRLSQAEDGLSEFPSLSPTNPPTIDCGLELPYRMMMPMCQLMHGDKKRCERSYVQYTIRGVTESRKWAEPCKYFAEDEACIPFMPCLKEETWRPIEFKRNSTVTNSTVTTSAPTLAPSTIATISPSKCPSMKPTSSPTITPTFAPTVKPTSAPTITPTFAPTIIPTFAPTSSPTTSTPTKATVCDGMRKGRCRNTVGCRYVSNKMGCRIRTESCSWMEKKYSCKNSQGCIWVKEIEAPGPLLFRNRARCEELKAQGSS